MNEQERAAMQAAHQAWLVGAEDHRVPHGPSDLWRTAWCAGLAYAALEAADRQAALVAELERLREVVSELESHGDAMAMHVHGLLLGHVQPWCDGSCDHVWCWLRRSLLAWRRYRGQPVAPEIAADIDTAPAVAPGAEDAGEGRLP